MVKHTAEREEDAAVGRGRETREGKEKATVPREQLQMCRCGDARCAWKQALRPGSSFGDRLCLPSQTLFVRSSVWAPELGQPVCWAVRSLPPNTFPGGPGRGEEPKSRGPSPQAPGPASGWWGGALLPKPCTQASPDCSLHPSKRLPPPLSCHRACARYPASPAHDGAHAELNAPAWPSFQRQVSIPNCGVPGAWDLDRLPAQPLHQEVPSSWEHPARQEAF